MTTVFHRQFFVQTDILKTDTTIRRIGTTEPKEKLQIGNTFTFHDGGNKAISRNFYYDAGTEKSYRIEYGKATSIAFGDTGTISLRVASENIANSEIAWRDALTVFNNGRVGIGTITPGSKFVVQGSASDASASSLNVRNSNSNSLFFVRDDGKVGIGTTEPMEKLQIGNSFTFHDGGGNKVIARNFYWDGSISRRIEDGKATSIAFGDTGTISLRVAPPGVANSEIDWTNALNITNNGRVGIGTFASTYKLEVTGGISASGSNGNIRIAHDEANSIIDAFGTGGLLINYYSKKNVSIHGELNVCKKLKVNPSSWCDFVFDETYTKPTIEEKELFYKANKHLPAVPSAKEIETDGLDVGDVMKGMMQNIEEDRLDITELYKRLIKLEKENEELKKQIEMLKK